MMVVSGEFSEPMQCSRHWMDLHKQFVIGRDEPSALIFSDNIYYGHDFENQLLTASSRTSGSTVFSYHLHAPERYAVVAFDGQRRAVSIEEKPKSNYAVTGLYFYDQKMCGIVSGIQPSA